MKPSHQPASLPRDLDIENVSFYSSWASANNIQKGVHRDYDYVAFEYNPNSETAGPFTVIALKTKSPIVPTTDLCRASGIQFERVGEWVIAFERGSAIRPERIGQFIEDILKLLEYAKGFPQNV